MSADQQPARRDGRVFERIPCARCEGTGRLKGVRAVAGSRAAVRKQWKAYCPECSGVGYQEIATKSSLGAEVKQR